MYPRTNKQNHKKKRKVDPPTHQVMTMVTLSSEVSNDKSVIFLIILKCYLWVIIDVFKDGCRFSSAVTPLPNDLMQQSLLEHSQTYLIELFTLGVYFWPYYNTLSGSDYLYSHQAGIKIFFGFTCLENNTLLLQRKGNRILRSCV